MILGRHLLYTYFTPTCLGFGVIEQRLTALLMLTTSVLWHTSLTRRCLGAGFHHLPQQCRPRHSSSLLSASLQ